MAAKGRPKSPRKRPAKRRQRPQKTIMDVARALGRPYSTVQRWVSNGMPMAGKAQQQWIDQNTLSTAQKAQRAAHGRARAAAELGLLRVRRRRLAMAFRRDRSKLVTRKAVDCAWREFLDHFRRALALLPDACVRFLPAGVKEDDRSELRKELEKEVGQVIRGLESFDLNEIKSKVAP